MLEQKMTSCKKENGKIFIGSERKQAVGIRNLISRHRTYVLNVGLVALMLLES